MAGLWVHGGGFWNGADGGEARECMQGMIGPLTAGQCSGAGASGGPWRAVIGRLRESKDSASVSCKVSKLSVAQRAKASSAKVRPAILTAVLPLCAVGTYCAKGQHAAGLAAAWGDLIPAATLDRDGEGLAARARLHKEAPC